jgi:hypothetical protein
VRRTCERVTTCAAGVLGAFDRSFRSIRPGFVGRPCALRQFIVKDSVADWEQDKRFPVRESGRTNQTAVRPCQSQHSSCCITFSSVMNSHSQAAAANGAPTRSGHRNPDRARDAREKQRDDGAEGRGRAKHKHGAGRPDGRARPRNEAMCRAPRAVLRLRVTSRSGSFASPLGTRPVHSFPRRHAIRRACLAALGNGGSDVGRAAGGEEPAVKPETATGSRWTHSGAKG